MAENVEAGGKALFNAAKRHWGWAIVAVFGVIVLAFWYDHKNAGKLSEKIASLPLVGKLFA